MKMKKYLYVGLSLLSSFFLWTIIVITIDVQAIGPNCSKVGLSSLNGYVHNITGVNMMLYTITDWLSLIPIAFIIAFGISGVIQWIKRKSLFKVDRSIMILGCFYVVVMCLYILFEVVVINYRPVLINGILETSYPSSTTMLVMCVIPTTIIQLKKRITNTLLKRFISVILHVFGVFMTISRLISGVHWFSDIVAGGLLSCGLVILYIYFSDLSD